MSQSSDFCRHNPLCCFSKSVYFCKHVSLSTQSGNFWIHSNTVIALKVKIIYVCVFSSGIAALRRLLQVLITLLPGIPTSFKRFQV
jgi:hypothetical protein